MEYKGMAGMVGLEMYDKVISTYKMYEGVTGWVAPERIVGRVIGILDSPSYYIEFADGTHSHCPQDLAEIAPPESAVEYWRRRAMLAEERERKARKQLEEVDEDLD